MAEDTTKHGEQVLASYMDADEKTHHTVAIARPLPTYTPPPPFRGLNAGPAAQQGAEQAMAPVAAAGCLTVGIANGAFWTLAPVYAQTLGLGSGQLALFMTVFIAGGALVQWPVGRISDGMDRRWVIAALCTVAASCGIALGLLGWFLVRVPIVF